MSKKDKLILNTLKFLSQLFFMLSCFAGVQFLLTTIIHHLSSQNAVIVMVE